jgi:hypothetical protein
MRHHASKVLCFIGAVAVSIACPSATLAVDGVILIDQNRAMAGNVTPGDTPGFPVEINTPGSYRLSSNLTVGTGASAGIKINSGNVTIDLNGFTIIGAGTINAPDIGIDARGIGGVTVIDGNIFNSSAGGVLLGDLARVENVRVTSTVTGNGIEVGEHSIVRTNVAYGNEDTGIKAGGNSLIIANTASHNGSNGIVTLSGSTLKDNVANDNGVKPIRGIGIRAVADATLTGNTTSFNGDIGILIGPNSTISGNTATNNAGFGIAAICPSSVIGNTAIITTIILNPQEDCALDHNAP